MTNFEINEKINELEANTIESINDLINDKSVPNNTILQIIKCKLSKYSTDLNVITFRAITD